MTQAIRSAHFMKRDDDAFYVKTHSAVDRAPQVTVVGAGLAGLMAAVALKKQGFGVTVLEARDRVGGRVHTCYRQGRAIEAGGEFVDCMRAHPTVHRAVAELGLELESTELPALSQQTLSQKTLSEQLFSQQSFPQEWGRHRLSVADIERVFGPIVRQDYEHVCHSVQALGNLVNSEAVLSSPLAARLDQLSLAQWRNLLDVHPFVGALLDRHIRLEYGEPEKTSLLYFALMNKLYENIADDELECFRIAGGNQKLPEALAQELGKDVVCEAPVVKAVLNHGQWEIDSRVGSHRSDYLVIAAPLPCVREIEFTPPLPLSVRRACEELNYADHFKILLDYPVLPARKPAAFPEYVQSDTSIQWTWSAPLLSKSSDASAVSGLSVVCYGLESGSDQAQLKDAQAHLAWATTDVAALSGNTLTAPIKGSTHFWGRQPYSQGSYSQYGPGQISRYWNCLRQPHQQLVFAGEHTAHKHVGYMEGALESGLRAASQIIELASAEGYTWQSPE